MSSFLCAVVTLNMSEYSPHHQFAQQKEFASEAFGISLLQQKEFLN